MDEWKGREGRGLKEGEEGKRIRNGGIDIWDRWV